MKQNIWNATSLAKVSTAIVFLALIRTLVEPFRLQHLAQAPPTFLQLRPLLLGALVASIGLLIMTMLYYYRRYVLVIASGVLAIVVLVIIKLLYRIP